MSPRASSQSAHARRARKRRSTGLQRPPRYSQSLERGLAILRVFTSERPVLGIADMADELGMSRSTTHRYVVTLTTLRFLEQTRDRKYRLGRRVFDLGMAALETTGLRERAHEHLVDLRDCTGYTASIGVLDGSDVLYVDRVASGRRGELELGLNIRAGSRLPFYCTALGKALAAGLPHDECRELIAGTELELRGPCTIGVKDGLSRQIDLVRESGLAGEREECALGLVAIAVPVRDEQGGVAAAVALEAPLRVTSLDELADSLAPQLAATAGLISGRLRVGKASYPQIARKE